MKPIQEKSFLLKAIVLLMISGVLAQTVVFGQVGSLRMVVNGSELPPVVRAEIRGAKTFLPIAPVARELGYLISIDRSAEIVSVRRAGVNAEFSRQTAEVRENGVTITAALFAGEVNFTVPDDDLLLPLEIAAPLLNVSIIVNNEKNSVSIQSREIGGSVTSTDRKRFEIGAINYNYNLVSYDGTYFQNFNLTSTGRIGSSIYHTNATFLGGTNARFLNFYGGNFTLRREKGDEFQFGDLTSTTASELTLINALVRGGSYTRPMFGERGKLSLYGGRASGGGGQNFLSPGLISAQRTSTSVPFDTNLLGGRFGFSPEKLKSNYISLKNIFFSAGSVWFNGRQNKGLMFDGAARYTSDRFSFQAEAAVGTFDRQGSGVRALKGFGTGIILSGSYTPWRFLTLQARYDRFSPNFANPLRTAQYNNRDSKSVSVGLRPFRNLSFGGSYSIGSDRNFFLSNQNNTNDSKSYRTESYSVNFAFDPNYKFLPRFSASATTVKNPSVGKLTFINANLSRDFKRFRPYLNYILTSGSGSNGHNFNFGTTIDAGKFGMFQAQQGFAVNKSFFLKPEAQCAAQIEICPSIYNPQMRLGNFNGSVDWNAKERLFKYLQISAGGGYLVEERGTSFLFRTTVGTSLPFRQNLQVSYFHSLYNKELRFSISGPLTFWKSDKNYEQELTDASLLTESNIQGRVYIDENGNRSYDAGVDIAVSNVRVRLDNGLEVLSDINGLYGFERIPPGERRLAVNFEDIRANLVSANGLEQKLNILPRTNVNTSFRLVKSGSISGRVWHDANQNGEYEHGEGLPDIHLVSSSGQDTYTDPDGSFLISELPPGQQSVYIDERYQSPDFTITQPSLRAEVFSGKETGNVFFVLKTKPREVKDVIFTGSNAKDGTPEN